MTLRDCVFKTQRFDINICEYFPNNSADNAQTLSFWNAAVEHGMTVKEIDDNSSCTYDDNKKAEFLLQIKEAAPKRERLGQAVRKALRLKYQLQIPEAFAYVNKENWSRFGELQQQNSSITRVIILMSAMHDESEIQYKLVPEKKKRFIDETIVHKAKRHDNQFANSEDIDQDTYTIENQEWLPKTI